MCFVTGRGESEDDGEGEGGGEVEGGGKSEIGRFVFCRCC